jgi:GT2 family glycosyltransferase
MSAAILPRMADTKPELSVVIPTLGNPQTLRRVLDGYADQDVASGSFEVIVVKDRAEPEPDRVLEAVGRRPYAVRVLTGTIPGASANRNVGWQAARAPIVLFTDDDTVPIPRLLSEHLSSHRRLPDQEVVVVGLVRWASGIDVTPFMRWLEDGPQFDFKGIDGSTGSWAHVYSANCSIKRSFLERVGGYDEQRLPYLYEDLDWGYRARSHGLRVVFERRAIVDHWRPTTLADWQKRAPALAVSERRFVGLHPDVPPWFYRLFSTAAAHPRCAGRSAALARLVPRRTPLLGRLVWDRAALYWAQQIAPSFLSAWEREAGSDASPPQPGLSAFAQPSDSSGGT